ncbi:MAG TPA: hypothetical protein VFR36_08895 [Sphingomicrobium sp.]|nr:hypothetical protein [Sphingomicrobium sp.]
MALGALIGAYQEDDAGGLRALLPLAGRTLVEYQARCLAAAGASPLIVLVERIPVALNEALERLRAEGIAVVAVSDGGEAASRFEAGSDLILLADGIAPDMGDLERLLEEPESAILTVPDDERHAAFERIDGTHRWAGLARVDAKLVGATAAMLGDWDLQSTLLRKAIQSGSRLVKSSEMDGRGPFLASDEDAMAGYERRLLVASRTAREDAVSRYLLPLVEEYATEKLMETRIRPGWLVMAALISALAAAFCFSRGWHWGALALLLLATPLDLVAQRLATLRLQPLRPSMLSRRLLWPAAGLALLALGWFEMRHGSGWGAMMAALAAAAFAEAGRVERAGCRLSGGEWHFSRRTAIWLALPFAIAGWWPAYLATLAVYAATSFFLVQHLRHAVDRD